MANFKGTETSDKCISTNIRIINNTGSETYYKLVLLCLIGLFTMKCDGAVLESPGVVAKYMNDNEEILENVLRKEQIEHEPPVTSSDLPKQIPAPPQPHFASTPHYEQQIARFVWVTPQYNTPYPIVKQV